MNIKNRRSKKKCESKKTKECEMKAQRKNRRAKKSIRKGQGKENVKKKGLNEFCLAVNVLFLALFKYKK